jgi:hypothetical protein
MSVLTGMRGNLDPPQLQIGEEAIADQSLVVRDRQGDVMV